MPTLHDDSMHATRAVQLLALNAIKCSTLTYTWYWSVCAQLIPEDSLLWAKKVKFLPALFWQCLRTIYSKINFANPSCRIRQGHQGGGETKKDKKIANNRRKTQLKTQNTYQVSCNIPVEYRAKHTYILTY